ncbi:CopG family transcriptional regulator [Halovenus salina]|uniref:CopG family transcriptional regulator n=1 Tax=Halovenus salina TaxID=1510225 RepID=A0ABD5W5T7_9EURY|nr:CopG family transcriptional regulator [Halovenus salina]
MVARYTLVCDDDISRDVRALAREHGVTEEEVLRQLVDLGLDALEEDAGVPS